MDCKRMKVTAIGIKGTDTYTATNYNKTECTNEPGNCGCIHAERALFEKVIPDILIISHSPCLSCAIEIGNLGIKHVFYYEEYRLPVGMNYLRDMGVNVVCVKS
jgi:deoxycytidylate deaminase